MVCRDFKRKDGARSRNRTGMGGLGPRDFKSLVSTNFTIRAAEDRRRHSRISMTKRYNQSTKQVTLNLEAGVGIEPAYTALQAAA